MADTKKKARETRQEVKNRAGEASETVRDYTENYEDIVSDLTKQVRDSYLSSMKLSLSLLENNLKMMNQFVGQWISGQNQIYSSFVDMSNPQRGDFHFGTDLIERAFSIQKEYIDEIRNLSEREIQKMGREVRERVS
ncbi:MAG TPA: hypothetical protein VHT73_09250 [Thermodesulfobacteriota bacterium]|nr:hypothetical protein [Thermodesulfobacteriota bacterium]